MYRHIKRVFWRDSSSFHLGEEDGQDLAEYGMLAALIAVVAILAVAALGTTLAALWGNITAAFAGLP
jgi:Flp pilus assembly pilin Flp